METPRPRTLMSENKDLTLLLTLWDRVPFTFRWMEYANRIKLPFKVFIADGSADDLPSRVLADHTNFPNVDYEYKRYPHDRSQTDYYDKLVGGLAHVDTPFVALADNDDFYVVDGLLRSIEFLKSNPDYSSCRGIIGGFKITPNADYGELSGVYGTDVSFVRQVYPDKPNLEATAVERAHNYLSCYRPNWYDVCRIEQARSKFKTLRDLNTFDIILSQHIPMLLGVIAGKVQIDSYLYLVRQLEAPGSSDTGETQQKGDLFDRMLLPTWSEDFNGFVETLAAAIAEKDAIPIDQARREVKRAYRNFIGPHLVFDLQADLSPNRRFRLVRNAISHLGAITGQPKGRQFIAGSRLSAADGNFEHIRDFLATPPSAVADPRRTVMKQFGS